MNDGHLYDNCQCRLLKSEGDFDEKFEKTKEHMQENGNLVIRSIKLYVTRRVYLIRSVEFKGKRVSHFFFLVKLFFIDY